MTAEFNTNDIGQALSITNDNECQYRIRSMHRTDIDTVINIEQATWPLDSWTYEYFLECLDDPLWNCWILERKTSTAGNPILGYGFQHISDETEILSHIDSICIHPDYRGCGLGGILLRYMLNYARGAGALTIELIVKTSNKHAYMLYVKHGFTIVRRLRKYYLDKSSAYLMQLIVTNSTK
jgi:ribosomal-protein-alanine N-acetyltransferase